MILEYLNWDSDYFDLKIGKISCAENCDEQELSILLEKAKEENYQLLYVFSPKKQFSTDFLVKNNGKLVDTKVIYELNASEFSANKSFEIEDYTEKQINSELLELAYLSGQHSRFRLDKRLPENSFESMYKTWIEKSVSGEMADKVFIAKQNNEILGFVTLKLRNGVGEIGLIAVSEQVQGKKIGTKLIDTCILYLKENSIEKLTVPTQKTNKQACGFYEKYGFQQYSQTAIYHFWI